MKKLLIKLSLILFILNSCQKNDKKTNIESNKKIEEPVSNSIKLDTQKEKLFLEFYTDMSRGEYIEVAEKLSKENILWKTNLIDFYYKATTGCKVEILANFDDDDSLKSITLKNAKCLYPLYKNKYNLPQLKQLHFSGIQYLENNPEYNPKTTFGTKTIKQIPNYYFDHTKPLKINEKKSPFETDYLPALQKSLMTIEKNKNLIIFEQNIDYNPNYDTVFGSTKYDYSLNTNRFKAQLQLEFDKKVETTINGKIYESVPRDYIKFNSVLRTIKIIEYGYINITYISSANYKTYNKEKNTNFKAVKSENRKKSVLDEI